MIIYSQVKTIVLISILLIWAGKATSQNNSVFISPEIRNPAFDEQVFNFDTAGFDSGQDDLDRPKWKGRQQTNDLVMLLIPVLRYLIIAEGKDINLQNTPTTILLPVMLQTLSTWWIEEQAIEIAEERGEKVIGTPVIVYPLAVPENGDPGCKEPCDTGGGVSQKSSAENGKQKRKRSRWDVREKSDAFDDDPPPPHKRTPSDEQYDSDNLSLEMLLNSAIHNQNIKDVEHYLEQGADPNVPYSNNYPIHLSICKKNYDIFNLLLKYGADIEVEAPGTRGRTPLVRALSEWSETDIMAAFVLRLLQLGASVIKSDGLAFRLVLHQLWDSHPELRDLALQQLRTHGYDLNSCHKMFPYRKKPLLFNIINNLPGTYSLTVLKWAVENGLDVDATLRDSRSPHWRPIDHLLYYVGKKAGYKPAHNIQSEILRVLINAGSYVSEEAFLFLLESQWDNFHDVRRLALQSLRGRGVDIKEIKHCGVYGEYSLLYEVASNRDYSALSFQWLLDEWGSTGEIPGDLWDSALNQALDVRGVCKEVVESISGKINILLNMGASFVHYVEPAFARITVGFSSLVRLFYTEWDNYTTFRELALQQVVKNDLSLDKMDYMELPVLVHLVKEIRDCSDDGIRWILSYLSKLSSLNKEMLGVAAKALLDSVGAPEVSLSTGTYIENRPQQGFYLTFEKQKMIRIKRILSRFSLLVEYGADLFLMDGESDSVFITLLGAEWDKLPRFRIVVYQHLDSLEIDINRVKVNEVLLIRYLATLTQKNAISIPGLYFALRSGLLPYPVDASQTPVSQELNKIYRELYTCAGLQYGCLIVLLDHPELPVQSACNIPYDLVNRSMRRVRQCLQGVLDELEAENFRASTN